MMDGLHDRCAGLDPSSVTRRCVCAPIRELRDLAPSRTAILRGQYSADADSREAQRLEKVPEDAGIRVSVVATDIAGASGRAIARAPVAGERDPAVLVDLSLQPRPAARHPRPFE